MPAYAQNLCDHIAIIRVGPEARAYGCPWTKQVTMRRLDAATVELHGLSPEFNADDAQAAAFEKQDFRDIERLMHQMGIDIVRWERKDDDGTTYRWQDWRVRHQRYWSSDPEAERLSRQAAGEPTTEQ